MDEMDFKSFMETHFIQFVVDVRFFVFCVSLSLFSKGKKIGLKENILWNKVLF